MELEPHFSPSVHIALFRLAPSNTAFNIFADVKSASYKFALVKLTSINEAPKNLALVKFALVKFDCSKFAPCKLD